LIVRNTPEQLDKLETLIETSPDPMAIPTSDPPTNTTITNAASGITLPNLKLNEPKLPYLNMNGGTLVSKGKPASATAPAQPDPGANTTYTGGQVITNGQLQLVNPPAPASAKPQ
jgi:hypothetical protein